MAVTPDGRTGGRPLGLGGDGLLPNLYDIAIFILIAGALVLIAHGAHEMTAPAARLASQPVTLDPANLPEYALRTTLRMFAAIIVSLLFTFVVATLAAKSRKAELVIVPALDILQSVPVLGFLTFTVVFFLRLFPGSEFGAECAAIFAIFTSQAWNMAFSFYQSLRTVPRDLDEVSRHFQLSPWLRFWRLEAPFAAPGLIWNTMMSMSGGWFFVVASEAITVGDTTVKLPGIGSWLAVAIDAKDIHAVVLAVLMMAAVILAYDQLLFRPIVAWADKFRFEQTAAPERPALMGLRSVAPRQGGASRIAGHRLDRRAHLEAAAGLHPAGADRAPFAAGRVKDSPTDRLWLLVVLAVVAYALWHIVLFTRASLSTADVLAAIGFGLLTLLRVAVLIALASVVWVPIGVWIGLRPWAATRVQPVAQFLAAFPANVLFPMAVVVIVRLASQSRHLAQPADGAGHAVVHPVQRHRRRQRLPDRPARGVHLVSPAHLAVVAQGHRARDPAVLRHRRAHRVGRLVERQHRGRGGELGRHQARSRGPRFLYRRCERCRRLSAGRARHRRHVGDGRDLQSPDLAAALSPGRTPLPSGLRSSA